jgi:hypothetical protein
LDDEAGVGVVSNDELTIISAPNQKFSGTVVWDTSGKLLPDPKLPPHCIGFTTRAIDGSGTVFGDAYCGGRDPTGFRITETGTQTISRWLKNSGLEGNFPPNTIVTMVSDNGKTVVGGLGHGMVCDCGYFPMPFTPIPTGSGPPGSESGVGQNGSFIAHVP